MENGIFPDAVYTGSKLQGPRFGPIRLPGASLSASTFMKPPLLRTAPTESGSGFSTSEKRAVVLSLVSIALCLFYACFYVMRSMDSFQDNGECQALVRFVTARQNLPPSISAPGQPAIFCDSGVKLPFLLRYNRVIIYGVTGKPEQETLLDTLRAARKSFHLHAMRVQFFARENRSHEDEELIRAVDLK
jgi:hypothetical protein